MNSTAAPNSQEGRKPSATGVATTAADAVLKAREIAARLSSQYPIVTGLAASPVNQGIEADNPTNKRKRWGVMSSEEIDAKRPVAQLLQASFVVPPVTKRLWVNVTSEKPAAHFVAFCQSKVRQLEAQANGEALNLEVDATQEEEGETNDPTKLRLRFKGKGSTNIPPLPGVPEEPLHVFLMGPKALVDQYTPIVDDLLNEAAQAATMVEAVQAAQEAQEKAWLVTREAAYKPMSVTALLHQSSDASSNPLLALPADRLAAALLHGTAAALTEEITVPNSAVGTIIGRGGETIASIQAQTNCKLQIQKEQDIQPGQSHRIITLSANTQTAIDQCKQIIESIVHERMNKIGGTQQNSIVLHDGSTVPGDHTLLEVLVPDADVGLIIGKMGGTFVDVDTVFTSLHQCAHCLISSYVVTIKQIQDQSGASLHIPKVANADSPTVRAVQITCPNPDGANLAKRLVEDVLKTKPGYSASAFTGANHSASGPQVSIQISIPDKDVGLCIGRGGCVIKYMQGSTNTRIQIPPTVQNPGDLYRVATVHGPTMEACQQVQAMIQRIIVEQSSAGVMSGNSVTQPSVFDSSLGPYENQPGYSAEWAAYHAAQQQQLQQSQNDAAQQQNQPQNHAVPAGTNEYTEPFFRYAYYYGEEAARLYYGAWSPLVGTPNPYGINPNGIAPAPATPAVTTEPATLAPVESKETTVSASRETSQRHVSNLPAWMTKKE
jgi:predicted RNA-binding protein YlqC (UPF0109 family)